MKGGIIVASIIVILTPIVKLIFTVKKCRRHRKNAVAFFHPDTNDGDGGERVLWCAVKGIQELSPDLDCVVYTADQDASPENLTARAVDHFGVALLNPLKVSYYLIVLLPRFVKLWIICACFYHYYDLRSYNFCMHYVI